MLIFPMPKFDKNPVVMSVNGVGPPNNKGCTAGKTTLLDALFGSLSGSSVLSGTVRFWPVDLDTLQGKPVFR